MGTALTRLLAAAVAVSGAAAVASPRDDATLPPRVRRIVLHVPGNPSYEAPQRRWTFLTPEKTQALWKPRFGAQWIVWTDGSIWPRHPRAGDEPSFRPLDAAEPVLRRRLAREAAPVYGHLHHGNSRSLGIEVAHSGRAEDPFPREQVRSVAWLLRALLEMSGGRLSVADVYGHKDLDRRPAYVSARCERPGCRVFTDVEGRPFRRRVDPPESLFAALAREGMPIPRRGREDDGELRRSEALGSRAAAGGVLPR
jgi:hypothetical protein